MLVLEGLVGLYRIVQVPLLQHYWLGHSLGLTEIILSFLRLHLRIAFRTLVYYEGYFISSQGFLPTIVDIMVI